MPGLAEKDGGGFERWQAPSVDNPGETRPRPVPPEPPEAPPEPEEERAPPPTLEQVERIEREAREEGFRQGEAEGRRAGAAAVRKEAEALKRVLHSLSPRVQDLDAELEQELVSLVVAVARQLVRRELRTDPGQVVAAVREALGVLPSSDRRIRLHLHPEDARIVRDALHLQELEQSWQVVEDPSLSRGGALLETASSRVDATVESRLNAVIAELWGGERREDGRADDAAGDGP